MKVLFAIRDDNNIVDTIVRKYQRDYNKKLVYKEVKNFTAILRELQQNNNYDRIVISDDIDEKINKSENKNKLILTKLKSIRSVALKDDKQIPIIFFSDNNKLTNYLYELNIYNGIIGTDITKKRIYELMLKPRNRLQAKDYYKINDEVVNKAKKTIEKVNKKNVENKIRKDEKKVVKSEKNKIVDTNKEKSNNLVSDVEKAIKYLNQVGLDEEKYVKKFDNICSKLSKEELQIVIKSLSLRTKKILKNNSSKYNKLISVVVKDNEKTKAKEESTVKRGRGRPRKEKKEEEPAVKRKRGRPRKTVESIEENEPIKKNVEENKEKKTKLESKKKLEDKNKTVKKEKNEEDLDFEENDLLSKEKKSFTKSKTKNKEKIEENLDEISKNKVDDDELDLDEKDDDLDDVKYNDQDLDEDDIEDDDDLDLDDEDDTDDIEDDDDLDLDEDDTDDIEDDDDLDLDDDDDTDDIEDDDDLDLDEDDTDDIEDDDDLDLDEDDTDDIEDDDDPDLDEDDADDIEDDDDLDLDDEDDTDDIEDDDDLNLDEDDTDDIEDDDDIDLDEDDTDDIEDDDDLDLDEDDTDDIEDDDDIDLDEDDTDDIEDDDDIDLDEDDTDDIEDDDDLNLDEDDTDDIEDDDDLNLDEDDTDDIEDDDDLNIDEDDTDNIDDDHNNKENTSNSSAINNNTEDDEIFDLDDNEFYDEKNAKSSENKNDDDFVFDVDDEKSDDEDVDDSLNLVSDTDDDDILNLDDEFNIEDTNKNENSADDDDADILNLDNDDLKVDDNQIGINQQGQFSGIRNKNYNPNYDISKQINEINGNTDRGKTEEEKRITIPEEKKIVAFVGAHGNGTSFIINNLALLLSEQGIKTAIVDLTKNKNSYYIFTQNEERLRGIAYSCFEKLKSGISDGIIVNKNLTVYTSLPNADSEIENKETAINTLLSEFSLVLFDCDTETDQEYFEIAQEIYLVQSLDVLTIQPLTTLLKKLKMNKLLNEEKLRILINKDLRVNKLNERILISAMSVYNSPDTTYQLDLFNRDKIGYLTIPFEEKNYSKYLDELADCKLTIRGYSKNLISSFNKLAKFVYPINGKKRK